MKYKFSTNYKKILSDTHTPVELYLKLRDKYPHTFLLESSEYNVKENSFSYLAIQPISSFKVDHKNTEIVYPSKETINKETSHINVAQELNDFVQSFESESFSYDFATHALFGYTSYDAIPLFENISFSTEKNEFPLIQYHYFKYLIVFNHFNNELFIFEHLQVGERSRMDELLSAISQRALSVFPFETVGNEDSNYGDEEFLKMIEKGKKHVFLGDVFQMVLSRKFSQQFKGDEFNVYRALRSVNPSPYLFYFDYGSFKIFGSSPEAQLTVSNNKATIHPIAGTFKRTGKVEEDRQLATALSLDPKENAEHIMLVDLARNDLSRHSKSVVVEKFKNVEMYSHVIHLVSKVVAKITAKQNSIAILTDTYPAGTLSGAPKFKAIQLIDKYENQNRGFYGGTIGILGIDGSINHAIFIRSFVSYKNTLHYQAGCGIVAHSNPYSELQEVNNKLSALKDAIQLAKNL